MRKPTFCSMQTLTEIVRSPCIATRAECFLGPKRAHPKAVRIVRAGPIAVTIDSCGCLVSQQLPRAVGRIEVLPGGPVRQACGQLSVITIVRVGDCRVAPIGMPPVVIFSSRGLSLASFPMRDSNSVAVPSETGT